MTATLEAPPAPGSEEWQKLVTASKVAAILGISPWESQLSLWLAMKGVLPREHDEDNPVFQRGHFMEPAILEWWKSQHPEFPEVEPQHYATLPRFPWAAATLDARVSNGLPGRMRQYAAVEIKTASKMEAWGKPGTDEIPPYYKAQVYWQMAMAPEVRRVYVAVLGPFLDLREYIVERDEVEQARIMAEAERFYLSLSGDEPPAVDDHVATFEALKVLHDDINYGEVAVVDAELAREYVQATSAEKAAIERARAAKSRLLAAAEKAQYIETADGVRIARRQPNQNGISLVPVLTEDKVWLKALAEPRKGVTKATA